jgi:hypothetical protein
MGEDEVKDNSEAAPPPKPVPAKKVATYDRVCKLEASATGNEREAATRTRKSLEAKYPGIGKARKVKQSDDQVREAAQRNARQTWAPRPPREPSVRPPPTYAAPTETRKEPEYRAHGMGGMGGGMGFGRGRGPGSSGYGS